MKSTYVFSGPNLLFEFVLMYSMYNQSIPKYNPISNRVVNIKVLPLIFFQCQLFCNTFRIVCCNLLFFNKKHFFRKLHEYKLKLYQSACQISFKLMSLDEFGLEFGKKFSRKFMTQKKEKIKMVKKI